jgi:hypothetical protein
MKVLRCLLPLLLLFATASQAFADSTIPTGTTLPVMLSTKLDLKVKPGKLIHARVMQDVPVPWGKIPQRSKLVGHVVSVSGNQVVFQFDSVRAGSQVIPIQTSLRAIASPFDVNQAQLPPSGSLRGWSSALWNTVQIGGQASYRGEYLVDAGQVVGESRIGGATFAPLKASPRGCPGSNTTEALWLFSSDACGLYGYPTMTITHDGNSAPVGQIALQSNGKLLVRSGSGLLLRVVGANPAP